MIRIASRCIIISISCIVALAFAVPSQAQDYFKRNLSINLFNEGVKLEREGNLAGAIEAYGKAIDTDPSNPYPYLNLGSIEYRKEDYLIARYFYLLSFKSDPSYMVAKQNIDICEKKLSQLNDKVIGELAQNSWNRGGTLASEGKPCEAAWEFMRFAGAHPEKGEGYLNTGKSLLDCKRYGAAEKNLSIAVQISGMNGELAWFLGEACEGKGDIKKALEMYRNALDSLEPGHEREKAKSLEEKIAALKKRIEQVQMKASVLENELSGFLPGLSEQSAQDLKDFVFNRISEGLEEHYIKDEIIKALEITLSGLNFNNGLVKAMLPPGWYQVTTEKSEGSPFALFRKWPGDTQLAFYLVQAQGEGIGAAIEATKKVAAADGAAIKARPLKGGFSNAERGVSFDADFMFDEAGNAMLRYWIFSFDGIQTFCIAAALAGTAGLSAGERDETLLEIENILSHVLFNRELWKNETAIPPSQRLSFPLPPEFPGTPPFTERDDPWRVIWGYGFTILLPPGIIGRAITSSCPERMRDSMVLWLRGEFVDSAGNDVKIGNGQFPGSLDILEFETKDKSREYALAKPKPAPPSQDPESVLLNSEDFTVVANETTGAEASSVAKFQGKTLPGKWIIFRMSFGTRVVEFSFPVLKGEDSVSLFWIPTTFRTEGMPPAFPPVDAAEKFKIRFKRAPFSETKGLFGKEGEVLTPELRIEVPSGWMVSINYRAIDGYPISLKEEYGSGLIRIFRVEPGRDLAFAKKRARELLCESCEMEWVAPEKPRKQHANNLIQAFTERKENGISESRMGQIYETVRGRAFIVFVSLNTGAWNSSSGQSIKRALSSLYFE